MNGDTLPRSSLPLNVLEAMQRGIMSHAYRGIDCYKCPMDLAMYQRLMWETKPRTVIEIGTAKGGSALWLADQLTVFGVEGFQVHSYDIGTPPTWRDDRIRFHQGDAYELPGRMPASWIAEQPRPLLVIEDSAHTAGVTTAVLEHFAPLMLTDEYIIIEDAIIHEMNADDRYEGGPRKSLAAFVASHPEFMVDGRWCNYYGPNVTWNVNGYLRRRAETSRTRYAERPLGPFTSDGGFCWTTQVGEWQNRADTTASPLRSDVVVMENGVMLGPAHCQHDQIRANGHGRYSHWGNTLYCSTSDGTNPNDNGRKYVAMAPVDDDQPTGSARPT